MYVMSLDMCGLGSLYMFGGLFVRGFLCDILLRGVGCGLGKCC